ncbi:MAG: type II toxin-antitoxin system Phd/YefM family antitoxin [Candidatus Tectomicrobia bacterium]|uniref:Antitoxin n=1 Tax=Tectimicrobiota bacterium TaxID=2528274 RepID=A0A932CN51_UNCTE|nr:type II toxin-antitoxin system Phd/YefM family antitoxin [Candidatus Tectomicrobia bacterium]
MGFKRLNITEARRHFCQIIAEQETSDTLQYVEVTHRGKPAVVIVEAEKFQELLRKAQAFDTLQKEGLPEIEGSLQIEGNLAEGSQKAAGAIWDAIRRSSEEL